MATGTFYLRPSADISLGHTVYPDTLAAGYLAISEEVADGKSTYITTGDTDYKNDVTGLSATSQFALSLNADARVESVASASLAHEMTSGTDHCEGTNASLTIQVYVAGELVCSGHHTLKGKGDSDYTESNTLSSMDTSPFVTAVNGHLASSGGSLPEITIQVENSAAASKSNGSNMSSGLSHVCIELVCEYATDIGIHRKAGGEWKAATAAYRKQGGAWVEITTDECKAVLQNSTIKS